MMPDEVKAPYLKHEKLSDQAQGLADLLRHPDDADLMRRVAVALKEWESWKAMK